jgi:hypothetical protein
MLDIKNNENPYKTPSKEKKGLMEIGYGKTGIGKITKDKNYTVKNKSNNRYIKR